MSLRILVIDDEESIRESIAIYFRDQGHEVVTAAQPKGCEGGRQSLCYGQEASADVIIIDQWMPGMTGIEYLARRHDWGCRAMGQRKALMTANLTPAVRKQAEELGCTVFEKPVRLELIEEWLATAP